MQITRELQSQKALLKPFPITPQVLEKVEAKLKNQEERVSFEKEPHLCSLVAALGVAHEMGKPQLDRLSAPLGVSLDEPENPWDTEVITYEGQFGLRMWLKSGAPIRPHEKDLLSLVHPLSLNASMQLGQLVIFPYQVFSNFRKRGFELVVVRDWALTAFLSKDRVNYLQTNAWELQSNTALTQSQLMNHRQIAFSGTHDIADHLINADIDGFSYLSPLFHRVQEVFSKKFSLGCTPSSRDFILSYGIGVLLDDLAQPRWYGSLNHSRLCQLFLTSLEQESSSEPELSLPESFHSLIDLLRNQKEAFSQKYLPAYHRFLLDLV